MLEQQFVGFGGQTTQRILQVSAGFTYSYDTTAAGRLRGSRNLTLNGTPIDPAATYQVTTNDFLANGGDGFTSADRRHRPGHRARLRRRRAGRVPRRPARRSRPGPANRITKLG